MIDDEKPINCPKCGKFMKAETYIGESSQEILELDCVCGHGERYGS